MWVAVKEVLTPLWMGVKTRWELFGLARRNLVRVESSEAGRKPATSLLCSLSGPIQSSLQLP